MLRVPLAFLSIAFMARNRSEPALGFSTGALHGSARSAPNAGERAVEGRAIEIAFEGLIDVHEAAIREW